MQQINNNNATIKHEKKHIFVRPKTMRLICISITEMSQLTFEVTAFRFYPAMQMRVIFQPDMVARDSLASATRSLRQSADDHIRTNDPDLTPAEVEAAYNIHCMRRRARQSNVSTVQQRPAADLNSNHLPGSLQPTAPEFNTVFYSNGGVGENSATTSYVSLTAATVVPAAAATAVMASSAKASHVSVDVDTVFLCLNVVRLIVSLLKINSPSCNTCLHSNV